VLKEAINCRCRCEQSRTLTLSPTSTLVGEPISRPSTGGFSKRTHVPLLDAPVTIESKTSPIRPDRNWAAADLRTCRSTLRAASSCVVQCVASAESSSGLYVTALAANAAFNNRCVTRSGNRRLGAVEWLYSRTANPKCPGCDVPGNCITYSPRPINLTIVSERSGNRAGSAWRRRSRNAAKASEFGKSGSCSLNPLAISRIRSHRSGERTIRNSVGQPCASRNCDDAPFAAIMKSSIIR
jgi:hypothetical protein